MAKKSLSEMTAIVPKQEEPKEEVPNEILSLAKVTKMLNEELGNIESALDDLVFTLEPVMINSIEKPVLKDFNFTCAPIVGNLAILFQSLTGLTEYVREINKALYVE